MTRAAIFARAVVGSLAGAPSSAQTFPEPTPAPCDGQLAQAVAWSTGAGGNGLDDLRKSLGVDTLDVGADDSGKGVGVGRQINDNIYVGVRQGATAGSSNVTVDIAVY